MASIAVELIDHMGTDLSVVNAARVSFDKESDWEYGTYTTDPDEYGLTYSLPSPPKLSDRDAKLIYYLAKHNHKSPFNHCFASFRVKAPIFCARQLVKHEYMPWNEISRRYVDSEPEFYTPDTWRKKADNVKQGSSDETVDTPLIMGIKDSHYVQAARHYQTLIENGVCAEQARMVLPQSTITEWIWSGSLFAIAKMCKLRLDPHTQYETRLVAQPIAEKMAELYPVSWKALMDV